MEEQSTSRKMTQYIFCIALFTSCILFFLIYTQADKPYLSSSVFFTISCAIISFTYLIKRFNQQLLVNLQEKLQPLSNIQLQEIATKIRTNEKSPYRIVALKAIQLECEKRQLSL